MPDHGGTADGAPMRAPEWFRVMAGSGLNRQEWSAGVASPRPARFPNAMARAIGASPRLAGNVEPGQTADGAPRGRCGTGRRAPVPIAPCRHPSARNRAGGPSGDGGAPYPGQREIVGQWHRQYLRFDPVAGLRKAPRWRFAMPARPAIFRHGRPCGAMSFPAAVAERLREHAFLGSIAWRGDPRGSGMLQIGLHDRRANRGTCDLDRPEKWHRHRDRAWGPAARSAPPSMDRGAIEMPDTLPAAGHCLNAVGCQFLRPHRDPPHAGIRDRHRARPVLTYLSRHRHGPDRRHTRDRSCVPVKHVLDRDRSRRPKYSRLNRPVSASRPRKGHLMPVGRHHARA